MAIHAALRHRTHYTYDKPVAHAPHVVRLRPAPHCRTPILSYSQHIAGTHFINWQQDPFANWNARIVFPDKMTEFCVEVELVAEMAVYNPFDFFLEENAEYYPFTYDPVLKKDLAPFLEPGSLTPTANCGIGCSGFNWASDYWFGTGNNGRFGAGDFSGTMDEVRLYDRVLTAGEIATLYASTK